MNLHRGTHMCLCLTRLQSLAYTSVQKHVSENLHHLFVVHVLIKGRWCFPFLQQTVLVSALFLLFKGDSVCIKKPAINLLFKIQGALHKHLERQI